MCCLKAPLIDRRYQAFSGPEPGCQGNSSGAKLFLELFQNQIFAINSTGANFFLGSLLASGTFWILKADFMDLFVNITLSVAASQFLQTLSGCSALSRLFLDTVLEFRS